MATQAEHSKLHIYVPFRTSTQKYPTSNGVTEINIENNAIMFYNDGVATVFINNQPLPSKQTFSIEGNIGEINKTVYLLTWPPLTPDADKSVFVTVKTYE